MIYLLIYLVIHIVCGVLGYLITRWWFLSSGDGWTTYDMKKGIRHGLRGPLFLLAVLIAMRSGEDKDSKE